MKWFVVSPAFNGIDSASELSAIKEYHQALPKVDFGDYVVFDDITHEITRQETCDVLALLSHADDTGVWLSELPYLQPYDVARIAKVLGAKLVYLNTCSSPEWVDKLAKILRAQGCDLIYYDGGLSDIEAVTMTVLYSAALAESGDFFIAYQQVTVPGGNYHYRAAHRGRDQGSLSASEMRMKLEAMHGEIRHLTMFFVALLLGLIITMYVIYQRVDALQSSFADLRVVIAELRSHVDFLERPGR